MLDVVLQAFTTLFVVIDPPGLLPVLLALTPGMAAGGAAPHGAQRAR